MNGNHPELYDWRADWLSQHEGYHVALLAPVFGELDDDEAADFYESIRIELRDLLEEPTLGSSHVDPYTGAGGFGLGVIWEIAGKGADLFAWTSAAIVAAQQIRKAATFLSKRLGKKDVRSIVFLSGEAVKALCVAQVCESGVDPRRISDVRLLEHKYPPVDLTVEKQQFYSAYTVTVEAIQPDELFHVWSFLVNSRGDIVSRGEAKIPMPNASQWFQVEPPRERLSGLD